MQTWEEKIIEREKALEEGIAIGERQGIDSATISSIRNLMTNLGLTPEQAMTALSVPDEKREHYLSQL